MLRCFVAKVSYVAILRFWWHFLAHSGTSCSFSGFFCTIWVFWAFHAVLLPIRFVVIYALFGSNYFGSNLARVKKVVFCISEYSTQHTADLIQLNNIQHVKYREKKNHTAGWIQLRPRVLNNLQLAEYSRTIVSRLNAPKDHKTG